MDCPVCGGKIVIDDSRGMMQPVCSVCNRVWGGVYLGAFWEGFEACKNGKEAIGSDIEENLKDFSIIVATGLLDYIWFSQHNPKSAYVPPTKEQVMWECQNVPLFNRAVDNIVSHLRHRFLTSAMHSDDEGGGVLQSWTKEDELAETEGLYER